MSKKTKKKQKQEEVDEDALLHTAIQEAHSQRIAAESSFVESNDDLFKPNLRQMDAEAEIREKLSQSMMKAKTNKGHNTSIKPIFKIKRNWPPFKTLGICFKLVKEVGAIKTFQAVHSPAYANLNLLFTSFRQVHDLDSITNVILSENPYHLESLFLLAHSYLIREEFTNASDTLERALYAISSSTFQFSLVSQEHQLNYKSSETRIIFQILFAYIQQLINRHCYNTALQFSKVLFMKDPVNDPLAVTLFIDFMAIRAGNYEYLINLFEDYGNEKNWNMLPNFLYNVSFAYHKMFEKTGDEKWERKEKALVKTALIKFPSFIGTLIDRLGLEPSDEVKKSGHFDTKIRCPKGIRILVNIVLKHSFDFWSQGYQLRWLQENATAFSKNLKEYRKEVTEWDAQCERVFVGLPVNVKRHAFLIGVVPETEEEQDFFDPFPPNPVVPSHDQTQSQGSLTGVVRSHFDGLMASLHTALDQIQQNSANAGGEDVPLPNDQQEGH